MPNPQVNDAESSDVPQDESHEKDTADKPDPTRFGDWEKNGKCVDF